MDDSGLVKYGELVVIGAEDAELLSKVKQRRFPLFRTENATAILPSRTEILNKGKARERLASSDKAAMSFELDEKDVIVSFELVLDKDMFQLGRSMSPKNDVQFTEIPTISRYACRIVVDRQAPHAARIYAAAFDHKSKIFLGQNAIKAEIDDEWDALITNGILILHPPQPEKGMMGADNATIMQWQPQWREVSVSGKLYKCKEKRSKPNMLEDRVRNETNQLVDGTLIDLGGVCLLWRSHDACKSFDDEALQKNLAKLNDMHNQCPVALQTLIIRKPRPGKDQGVYPQIAQNQVDPAVPSAPPLESDPCAFKLCGHVLGSAYLDTDLGRGHGKCPLCRMENPDNVLIKLQLGSDPRVYVDNALPTWFFKPCGHIASELTAKYWSRITMRTNGIDPIPVCPFCTQPLDLQTPIGPLYFE